MNPKIHFYKAAIPFLDASFTDGIRSAGFTPVQSIDEADWVVSSDSTDLRELVGRCDNVMLATIEPRPTNGEPLHQRVHGTNVYTFDLNLGFFEDIWLFFLDFGKMPMIPPDWISRERSCVVATNQTGFRPKVIGDLIEIRWNIVRYGSEIDAIDVYGSNWKHLKTKGSSRRGDEGRSFSEIKHEILSGYRVNFALENTYIPNYVTEKFWHAGRAGCVPVYLGSSWMDRIVSSDHYVDLRRFSTPQEVFAYIDAMTAAQADDMVFALQQRISQLDVENKGASYAVRRRWADWAVRRVVDLHNQNVAELSPWHRQWVRLNQ